MSYRQVTSTERHILSYWRRQGLNQAQIAKRLDRHPSTISRELRRNCSTSDGRYRAEGADQKARARRSRSRRNTHFSLADFALVSTFVREEWSPDQISGRFALLGVLSISHETIYRYVWRDKYHGGTLHKHLRQSPKRFRKRYKSYDSRGRKPGKRHISERPKSANDRSQFGHWEVDTVVGSGSNHCIVTLVERKSGLTLIGKLKARTREQANSRILKLMRKHPERFKTITADNGTEFHDYEYVEISTGVKFYFATPYHSWERGTNENTNGLIRQYVRKKANMAGLTQHRCNNISKKLNSRPRKRLGYLTPEEYFAGVR